MEVLAIEGSKYDRNNAFFRYYPHPKISHPRISFLEFRYPRMSSIWISHLDKIWSDGALGDPIKVIKIIRKGKRKGGVMEMKKRCRCESMLKEEEREEEDEEGEEEDQNTLISHNQD